MSQISGVGVDAALQNNQVNRFSEMGSEDFLQIIFTELTNQDPLSPNDTSALLEQLNSIRSIESDLDLSRQLQALVTDNQLASAGNMLGKLVTGRTENLTRTTGVVVAVLKQGDAINLELDTGEIVPLGGLESVIDPLMFLDPNAPPPLDDGEGSDEGAGEEGGEDEDGVARRMVVDPIQLLRKLEPPVRPVGAPGIAGAGRPPLEQQSFDQLLSIVSTGSIRSGRPVTLDPHARLDALDDAQLARLADAADAAEAAGSRRAVMLIDGRGLVLDIASRTVSSELAASGTGAGPQPILGIDAAVYVEGEKTETPNQTEAA